jgi:hypothetical protein
MGFSAKRGRPKTKLMGRIPDFGTEQLQAKRRQNATIEPLDLLLQKSLISNEQHSAGIHLRWLYTLKMGAPNISASNLDEFYGRELRQEDDNWRESREAEYNCAVEILQNCCSFKPVMDIAVFGVQKLPLQSSDLAKIREGLSLLCKTWQKKRR